MGPKVGARLVSNCCSDFPVDLVQLYTMCPFPVRESAHHFVVEPRYDVNVHVEDSGSDQMPNLPR